jgi:hypothetical protein
VKQILLISYYFPPCGGAGVQRWLRLLPLLVEQGYRITVITTKNGDYPMVDESLLSRIPAELKVIRTFTPVFGRFWNRLPGKQNTLPYGSLDAAQTDSWAKKLMYWVRLNLIYPDIRVIWNPFAFRAAWKACSRTQFDWVITTGPPHSTQLIGLALKKRLRLRWLADFRDPWTQIYYLKLNRQNRLLQKLNSSLERQVVSRADINLVISSAIANQLPVGNKTVFYNGYDAAQFQKKSYQAGKMFRIKYIGQITEGQDIKVVFDLMETQFSARLCSDIEFSFVGTNVSMAGNYSFPILSKGYVPHQEALAEMVDCELLILLINDYKDNQGMLTTKLFEYIGSRTPILCIGPLDGEAAHIISAAHAGRTFSQADSNSGGYLLEIYTAWQQGKPIRNSVDVAKWSVQQQIIGLTELLSS